MKSTLNLAELLVRVDNDRDLLKELLIIFKQECGPLLFSLREAISREDMKKVEVISHSLKGMFASLAASQAAAAARNLEKMGTSQQKLGLEKALTTLENEIELLMPQVEACLNEAAQ